MIDANGLMYFTEILYFLIIVLVLLMVYRKFSNQYEELRLMIKELGKKYNNLRKNCEELKDLLSSLDT